jgi:AbrB family looped-hinge helix DNA binding protein
MPHATKLGGGGRVVIPAKYRKALGLRPGDEVWLSMEDGDLRLSTRARARKRAQDYVSSLVSPGVSLAGELIRERRKAAAGE